MRVATAPTTGHARISAFARIDPPKRESSTGMSAIERWFITTGIRPQLRGELSDSALLKTFGRAGIGAFVAPTAVEREVREQYQVRVIGRIPVIRARLYVVSASRKVEHPAAALISETVASRLFR